MIGTRAGAHRRRGGSAHGVGTIHRRGWPVRRHDRLWRLGPGGAPVQGIRHHPRGGRPGGEVETRRELQPRRPSRAGAGARQAGPLGPAGRVPDRAHASCGARTPSTTMRAPIRTSTCVLGRVRGARLLDHACWRARGLRVGQQLLPVGALGTDRPGIAEFCILPTARRGGVGMAAAVAALQAQPGQWELQVYRGSPDGMPFWPKAIAAAGATDLELIEHDDRLVYRLPDRRGDLRPVRPGPSTSSPRGEARRRPGNTGRAAAATGIRLRSRRVWPRLGLRPSGVTKRRSQQWTTSIGGGLSA